MQLGWTFVPTTAPARDRRRRKRQRTPGAEFARGALLLVRLVRRPSPAHLDGSPLYELTFEGLQLWPVVWYQRKYCRFIVCGVVTVGGGAHVPLANTARSIIEYIGPVETV